MQLVEPRPSRPMPIRITPLIDVVFILLVFFMLTSRLLPTSFLELDNNTGNGQAVVGERRPGLRLDASGQVLWQEQTWDLTALTATLRRQGHREVNLATSEQTPLTSFTEVLTALQSAGINAHWQRNSPAQDSD
ncbi:MAG: biopolymer transporter ExbD [Marinobacter sp.]|nr:biopolymer transporter ExbD [Marinobacter sp.]